MTMDVGRRPLARPPSPPQSPPPSRSRGLSPPHTTRSPSRYRFSFPSPLSVWIYVSHFPIPTLSRPPGFSTSRRPALLDSRPLLHHGRRRGAAPAQEEGQDEEAPVGAAAARGEGRRGRQGQGQGQVRVALAGLPRSAPADKPSGYRTGKFGIGTFSETEAKKRRLERINRRKLGLLAEVKFLRKKFSSFVNDDPQQTHHSLKSKKARQIPSTLGRNEGPSTSKGTNLDLNQDSAMNGERAGRQGYQDHSEPGKHGLVGVDEDIMNSNVNLSGYRDAGNSQASDDKRATAWQDRVALKI